MAIKLTGLFSSHLTASVGLHPIRNLFFCTSNRRIVWHVVVGDIITFSRSIADYASMYAAIFSIIVLAVVFLNLLEMLERILFEGNVRGYASD